MGNYTEGMIHSLAGLLLMGIGVLIIFTPPMIEAYRIMQVDWHRVHWFPVIALFLISEACIITGLLIFSGTVTLYFLK